MELINEAMFEWAVDIQRLVKKGWEIRLEYGERRLGIGPKLICTKGKKERTLCSPDDMYSL